MLTMEITTVDRERIASFANDERWGRFLIGLAQLAISELGDLAQVVDRTPSEVLLDQFNYDPSSGLWCPLAIGLGVPAQLSDAETDRLSSRKGREAMIAIGRETLGDFDSNPLSGVGGNAYTVNRLRDLRLGLVATAACKTSDADTSSEGALRSASVELLLA